MEVSKEIIKEIVDTLDTGFRVFLNSKTFEIVSFPDEDNVLDFDKKIWGPDIKKVKNKKNFFTEIEKPDSREGYKIMEDFINSISDRKLAEKLTQAIEGFKPFANFKFQIDQSGPFREMWFTFKENQMMEFVKDQIDVMDA